MVKNVSKSSKSYKGIAMEGFIARWYAFEPGIENFTEYLYNAAGVLQATTTTFYDGSYGFTGPTA